jgi:glycosyltransferase involved in cell wall biosynthesis
MKLSIVVPCYNEEEVVPFFYDETVNELNKINIDYELIFVDDGSKDNTLSILKRLSKKDKNIKIISFSRNFGKESAMLAGLEKVAGDYAVIMDADLQNPPHLLKDMLAILQTGEYDCVATYRKERKGEPILKSLFSNWFYGLANLITDVKMVNGASDYRMMTKAMVQSLLEMKEYFRFTKGMFAWVGYKTKYIEYENIKRKAGKTKWSFLSLFKYALEGVISFTITPLRMATVLGLFTIFIALIYIIYILICGSALAGWTAVILIVLLLGGFQLLSLGIIGEYLGRTYYEAKRRPSYIIKEYIEYDK